MTTSIINNISRARRLSLGHHTYRITEGVARNQNATYLLKNILKEQEI